MTGGSLSHDLRVGDVVNDTTHQEGFVQIPPQGGLQAHMEKNLERKGRLMAVSPYGGIHCGGGIKGGGDLHLSQPQHSHTVHNNQAHYGPVSGGVV